MALFEPVFDALNRADVRYVVVGGVAVVLHGFARLTGDVDLAIDLRPAEARKAVETFAGLGLRPRLPVDPLLFADAAVRESWVRDKHMRVFTFLDPTNPMLLVDCFAADVLPFGGLWARSQVMSIASTTVRVASIADLIALKRLAGRLQDQQDVEGSRRFSGEGGNMADFDAGWDATRRFQIERALEASAAQRLTWLEEMIAFAYRTGALPREQNLDRV